MPYDFRGNWAYKKGSDKRIPKKQAIAILLSEKRRKGEKI